MVIKTSPETSKSILSLSFKGKFSQVLMVWVTSSPIFPSPLEIAFSKIPFLYQRVIFKPSNLSSRLYSTFSVLLTFSVDCFVSKILFLFSSQRQGDFSNNFLTRLSKSLSSWASNPSAKENFGVLCFIFGSFSDIGAPTR